MKTKRKINVKEKVSNIAGALNDLSFKELELLISDLFTPNEIDSISDRWDVAKLLNEGLSYREINKLTGVSITTIGRVSRYLINGNGGYEKVLIRKKNGK